MQSCFLCNTITKEAICESCQENFITSKKRCISCACVLETSNLDYCGKCLVEEQNFDNAYTIYNYQGVVAYLIQQFKYNNRLFLGKFFAKKIKKTINFIYKDNKFPEIIAMPIYKQKTKKRGFNQVIELLTLIDKKYINNHSCLRVKATKPFASLKLVDREKEIKNAFKVSEITSKHILLVDDVMTTGSSFSELAKSIKKANPKVKQIDVLSLARAQI